jgi:Na+-driven multidrug efflux pump
MTAVTSVASFLVYGTTGGVARAMGAGRREAALDLAVQATWLALLTGLLMGAAVEALAPLAARLVGGGHVEVQGQAVVWLRIAALGLPFVCVTLAGQGWLRGLQDTLTPFLVVAAGNAVSAVLSAVLVYGAHLGIRGSAIANALAQSGSAVVFAAALARRGPRMRPSPRRMAVQLDGVLIGEDDRPHSPPAGPDGRRWWRLDVPGPATAGRVRNDGAGGVRARCAASSERPSSAWSSSPGRRSPSSGTSSS